MKLWRYLKQLIQSDSKESSKRFMFLYVGLILMSYVVFRFTSKENAVMMLGTLCGFVLTLAGVASWQVVKLKSKK